jgi:[ribosomal protein S5]-alanine N-acetyltransferase
VDPQRNGSLRLDLPIDGAVVRSWRADDLPSIVRHANNREIARQLRDRFPHPYEPAHALGFLQWAGQQPVETVWAIAFHDTPVGGIGVQLGHDIERVSAEIGYWLGQDFWGRGLATAALRSVTDYAFEQFGLSRIFAVPFDANRASIRVLEKAGYVLEGHLRRSAIKDGVICDQRLYARYKST